MRARGAQSVVLMKRTTSVTLHSNGLVSKHNFWGGSVFDVYKHAGKLKWAGVEILAPKT